MWVLGIGHWGLGLVGFWVRIEGVMERFLVFFCDLVRLGL